MVYTAEARRTTQGHHKEQIAISSLAVRDLLRIFPAWSLEDLDATWEPVLTGLLGVGEHYHRLSSMRAAAYYSRLRLVSQVPGEVVPVVPSFDREAAIRNLSLLGPIFTKKGLAANRPNVMQTALTRLTGAMILMVMQGGRDTVQLTTVIDSRAKGTIRVTSGTCDWCLQLKAWGQDGKGPMVEGRSFKGHTNCRCSAEPAWDDRPPEAVTQAEGGPFNPDQPMQPLLPGGVAPPQGPFGTNPTLSEYNVGKYDHLTESRYGGGGRGNYAVEKAVKVDVQKRIGTRLEGRFSHDRLNEVANQIGHVAYDYDAPAAFPGQRITASLNGQWAGTSGDTNYLAIAMQKSAAKRFDLDFDVKAWTTDPDVIRRVDEAYDEMGDVMEAYVDEMYKETQDLLDVLYPGQTHVPLGRGVQLSSYDNPDIKYQVVSNTEVAIRPMSSFSIADRTAESFGNFQIRASVPKERILSTPFSGFGCLNEYEHVVLAARTPDPVSIWRAV